MRHPEHTWYRIFGPEGARIPIGVYASHRIACEAAERFIPRCLVYGYASRERARQGQASDAIGEHGRVL